MYHNFFKPSYGRVTNIAGFAKGENGSYLSEVYSILNYVNLGQALKQLCFNITIWEMR